METHSLTWFIVTLSAACVAFGIVMAWFQERDEKKAYREGMKAASQEIEQKCKAIRMRPKITKRGRVYRRTANIYRRLQNRRAKIRPKILFFRHSSIEITRQ